MYPTKQYMDPYYSYCRDHPPYPYCPPPAWEAGHPHMAMNSSCQPPSYGPFPYSGSTSHSHLPESHSCCHNTCPPGYYSFRPPFSQELPPHHLYYHGPFPHHLNTCHSFFVPPPPYPVDQIPYGSGKFKGHCCGCPNHVCHGGEKSNLKIEEEMPDVKPDSEQKGDASIIGHPSYQYPAMWLPSGNVKDNVKGRTFEMPPQLFSKWFPETVEWPGDGKQQGHGNHNARQLQWPVIWMPRGYDEPKQETKELKEVDQRTKVIDQGPEVIDQIPKVTKEAPRSPDAKIIPLSWFEDDHNDQKPVARDGSGEHNGRSSVTNQSAGTEHRHDTTVRNIKTIPVVPGELKYENKPAEKICKASSVAPDKEGDEKKIHTCRTIPVMVQKKNDDKANNIEEGGNWKSNNAETSKAKLSKLPPVCLRVDPLPRKKSGNRSAGSPNPATKKVCEKENDMKEAKCKNQETKLSSEPNKESNVLVKEKTSEMDRRIGSSNVTVQDASVKPAQDEEISPKVDQKVQPSIRVKAQENASAGSLQERNKVTEEDEMKFQGEASKYAREISLSQPDAAVRIQSAYRGYDVRRWRPLDKLRKVKKVHDQMQDLKKHLQGLEASSKQLTVKEQVTINETIMNLLLNLDSIQGLHPSVREARKSVARELVCLQEKLDSLCKQRPAESNLLRCEKEQPERTDTDNATKTTANVSTAEASEEEKFAGAVEEQGTTSVNSSEVMNDEASYGIAKELRQDAGSTEKKHEMKESSTTHDEGKAAPPGECEQTSSMDVRCDAALLGHSTEQKHHMEESNTMSREESSEKEKAASKGEGHEVSSVDCVESSHDECLPEESSPLGQHSASTEHNSCTEESNTGVSSPGATEDRTAAMATISMQSVASVDQNAAAEGQVWQSAASESSVTKPAAAVTEDRTSVQFAQPCVHLEDEVLHEHDPHLASIALSGGDRPEEVRCADMPHQVADTMQDSSAKEPDGTPEPAADGQVWQSTASESSATEPAAAVTEDDQYKETSVQFTQPCVNLKDAELQEHDPQLASVAFGLGDQPEEATGANMQNHAADSMHDSSGEGPDVTPEAMTGDTNSMDCDSTDIAENSVQSLLSQPDSALQQSCLRESEAVKQCEVYYEDDPALVGQPIVARVENQVEGSSIGEKHEAVSFENEAENMEHVTGVPSNMCAEPGLPGSAGNESVSDQDGTTMFHENPDSKMSLESQSHSHVSGDKTSEGTVSSEAAECSETLEEASVCAEIQADHQKGDAGNQMASEEAAPVPATHDAVNNNDEKNLADENLKLKEMLQKLLSSGNDQVRVITELSEKVKVLERELARKRRPKVRVCRPARIATANPH